MTLLTLQEISDIYFYGNTNEQEIADLMCGNGDEYYPMDENGFDEQEILGMVNEMRKVYPDVVVNDEDDPGLLSIEPANLEQWIWIYSYINYLVEQHNG